MARLDQLPEASIIDGMKGLIDYYCWKGIAVARRWPRYFARKPSPAEAINQTDFAYINKLYSTLPVIIIQALTIHATGTTQVSKDYLVRAYLKGLFQLMPPEYYMTEETGQEISDRIGAVDGSDAGSAIDRLADLLTELTAKLEPGHLNIEAVSLDLQVDDKTDYLDQQDVIQSSWRVHSVGDDRRYNPLNITGKGILLQLDFSTEYHIAVFNTILDGVALHMLGSGGGALASITPQNLDTNAGTSGFFFLNRYDLPNNRFYFTLLRPIQFNSSLSIQYGQASGANKWISHVAHYRLIT